MSIFYKGKHAGPDDLLTWATLFIVLYKGAEISNTIIDSGKNTIEGVGYLKDLFAGQKGKLQEISKDRLQGIELDGSFFAQGLNGSQTANGITIGFPSEALNQLQSNLANILGVLQAAKQAQLQQNYLDTSGTLQEGIAQETMTTRQFSELKLGNNLNAMQSRIDELGAYGYDVSSLVADKARYEESMKDKFAKAEKQARTDMVNDTALTKARLSGDSKQIANAEFDITKTALDRAKEQKEKDTDDSTLARQWYGEKLKEAERQRQQTIREGQITEYNDRVQHNELLKDLEGKTQAEIDRENRGELQKKLSYLDTELKQTALTMAEKVKLEQEMADAVRKNRELDSRDPDKAVGEAKRRLKERTTDYAAIMTEPFDRINSSMEQHFTAMLTGAESFSKGFKGIFQDMTTAITNMMVKMWLNKMVMGPLEKWWGGLLDGLFGGGGGTISQKEMRKIDDAARDIPWQSPSVGTSPSTLPPVPPVTRGLAIAGQSYLAGGFVPEPILPVARFSEAFGAAGSQAPPVTVNVINKTGVQTDVRQDAQWDGQQYIVNVVLDAYSRNVNGMRDVMGTRRLG